MLNDCVILEHFNAIYVAKSVADQCYLIFLKEKLT